MAVVDEGRDVVGEEVVVEEEVDDEVDDDVGVLSCVVSFVVVDRVVEDVGAGVVVGDPPSRCGRNTIGAG